MLIARAPGTHPVGECRRRHTEILRREPRTGDNRPTLEIQLILFRHYSAPPLSPGTVPSDSSSIPSSANHHRTIFRHFAGSRRPGPGPVLPRGRSAFFTKFGRNLADKPRSRFQTTFLVFNAGDCRASQDPRAGYPRGSTLTHTAGWQYRDGSCSETVENARPGASALMTGG